MYLLCTAIGTDTTLDPIVYLMVFQNSQLPDQTTPELSLSPVSGASAGFYFAVASNSLGLATSVLAHLTVYRPPIPAQTLSNQVVDLGNTVILAANFVGTAPLAYSWYCNGIQLENTNSTLFLTNISLSQSGFYSVAVSNLFGSTSSTCKISVLPSPSQVLVWGDNSAGQTAAPTNLADAVAGAAGDFHSVVLRHDGTLVGWGCNVTGQLNLPVSPLRFVFIAAGSDHNLAIAEDGSVVAWGNNAFGQCDIPPQATNMALAVSAGEAHSLLLNASRRGDLLG